MTDNLSKIAEILHKHFRGGTGNTSEKYAAAQGELLDLIESLIKQARRKELEIILYAAYSKGTFANPTPALNEFLEKTSLIPRYVITNRIKELGGDK